MLSAKLSPKYKENGTVFAQMVTLDIKLFRII